MLPCSGGTNGKFHADSTPTSFGFPPPPPALGCGCAARSSRAVAVRPDPPPHGNYGLLQCPDAWSLGNHHSHADPRQLSASRRSRVPAYPRAVVTPCPADHGPVSARWLPARLLDRLRGATLQAPLSLAGHRALLD